jgi:hypothetical protein
MDHPFLLANAHPVPAVNAMSTNHMDASPPPSAGSVARRPSLTAKPSLSTRSTRDDRIAIHKHHSPRPPPQAPRPGQVEVTDSLVGLSAAKVPPDMAESETPPPRPSIEPVPSTSSPESPAKRSSKESLRHISEYRHSRQASDGKMPRLRILVVEVASFSSLSRRVNVDPLSL